MSRLEIPPGLTDLLQTFVVQVLRQRPDDLIGFAAQYFHNLENHRDMQNRGESRESYREKSASNGEHGSDRLSSAEAHEDEDAVDDLPQFDMKKLQKGRRVSVAAESFNPEDESNNTAQKIHIPKTEEQRKQLNEAVRHILLFRCLEESQLHEVLDAMSERRVKPGEFVIKQGEDGDNFYVIASGKYTVLVKKPEDTEEKEVFKYEDKGSFGELALMYNQPRAATVRADSEGLIWALDRDTFRRVVVMSTYKRRKTYEAFIENVPLLKELELHERTNVADALVPRTCEPGEVILRQGDHPAEAMFIVEDGEVEITAKDPATGVVRELKICKRGDYFGELALIAKAPRAATAVSRGKTRLAVLDVAAFERLLGHCMDVMRRNASEMQKHLEELFERNVSLDELRGGGSSN